MKHCKLFLGTVLMLLLAGSSLFTYAQEPLQHEKTTYVAPDGTFYINKDLPLYLWMSTSPDPGSEKQRLQSQSTPQYANPFYFDTEGYNSIRTPWQVDTTTREVVKPLQELVFEVYADSKPPEIEVDYGNTKFRKIGGTNYCGGGQLTFELAADDEVSGVKQIYYSMNGAAFTEYKSAIEITEEKEYIIKYYAVDNVGNANEVEETRFIADFTGPVTGLDFEKDYLEDEAVLSSRTKITFTAEDQTGVAGTYYSIDGSAFKKIFNYLLVSPLSEGRHVLRYYSIDELGNKETEKRYEFFLDKSAPIVVDEVLGSQFVAHGRGYSSGRTKFKLTAVDNKAGVKDIYYSINGSQYQLYEEPFYLPSKSGSMSIKFYAVDRVNNKGGSDNESSRTSATYVDLTGPNLDFDYNGPTFSTRDTVFISNETKIELKATDNESGLNRITYSIDQGPAMNYDQPFNVPAEGIHRIDYTGYDNVDNSNRSNFFFIVDNTPPEGYWRFSILPLSKEVVDNEELEVYPSHVVLFLPATDAKSGFKKMYYSINEGSERPYNRFIDGFQKNRVYHVKARVIDQLGNETIYEVKFKTTD